MKTSLYLAVGIALFAIHPDVRSQKNVAVEKPQVLYGAAYYHEYMPEERLAKTSR